MRARNKSSQLAGIRAKRAAARRRTARQPNATAAKPAAKAWLIFDLDGVLVDVHGSYRQAIVETVAHFGGGRPAAAEVQAIKNLGGYNNDWDVTRELLRRRGLRAGGRELVTAFDSFYLGAGFPTRARGLIRSERWLLSPVLLARLRRRYRLAIFTGRPRAQAEYVLRRFRKAAAFARLLGHEDVRRGKPHPEGLRRLCRECAPAPVAAYIGDTIDDARCAQAAGIPFYGILPRQHATLRALRRLFRECGCRAILPDINAAAARLLAEEQP